jgi:NAD+ kinase
MHSIAIVGKQKHVQLPFIGAKLFDFLHERSIKIYFEQSNSMQIERKPDGIFQNSIPEFIDLVIALGGDGTILRIARSLNGCPIPVMAVNLGSLGFLTAFTLDELIPGLERILSGEYAVSSRLMLSAEHYHNNALTNRVSVLNDVVINKATLARIIQLETKINQKAITKYLCDGLIVSTPTGSTAYSLSAGGPIIQPMMEAFVLTPICPHTLTNRPIVVGSSQEIQIQLVSSGSEVLITLDGQIGWPMSYLDHVTVRKSPNEFLLIENSNIHFFEVLQHKLKWGQR